MKNYYDQQQELEIAKERLQTLKEKKLMYFNETQPKSKKINGVMVKSSGHADKFTDYAARIETIDIEIDLLENEVKILNDYIKKMEYKLRTMKGTLEKVFVNKYIDNISVNEIAKKLNYSPVQIYRFLKKINKILKDDKK